MTHSSFATNDLVIRINGGHRDGELIAVRTTKCLLSMDQESSAASIQPQCAIFRGPKGAAFRSYDDGILVNGVASTLHWLKPGDRIEFPNAVIVEITQLGWVDHKQPVKFSSVDTVLEDEEGWQPQVSQPVNSAVGESGESVRGERDADQAKSAAVDWTTKPTHDDKKKTTR